MPLNVKQKNEIMTLLILALEGEADSQQLQKLKRLLHDSPEARDYYLRAVIAAECIRKTDWETLGFIPAAGCDESLDTGLWKALADEEIKAPSIQIAAAEEPTVLIQKVHRPKVVRKVSKSLIFSLAAAAAAVVFVVLFARFAPPKGGMEVAVLSDSLNALWADTSAALKSGTRLAAGAGPWLLREGMAEVVFDNEARIVLEGPCEFDILTSDQILLNYGRLYAAVPQGAIGFIVNTPSARIIDLGTEFGVQADAGGDTCLYVLKGRTTLIAGRQTTKLSMEVGAGAAKKVSADMQTVADIPCNRGLFVRDIDSKTRFVWKGQGFLDLADIAGGGSGLGTGNIDMGIDPISGNPVQAQALPALRTAANTYHPVRSSPLIDGVFVPNGQSRQVVSSQGHVFQECPKSSGACYGSIIHAIRILDSQTVLNAPASDRWNAHCLLMHANMGITYDLQAIRALLPDVRIVRFQTKFGIEKEAIRPSASNADFWILIDGKLRHQEIQVKEKTLFSVDIELSDNDRFLTLVTTDGQDPEDRVLDDLVLTAIDSDWCMYADPVLVLETK